MEKIKDRVSIDFETRSRVNIKKSGAGRYCTDPSTEIVCCAWAVGDGKVQSTWGGGFPMELQMLVDAGHIFVAHNASFEYGIWKYVWGQEPPQFQCTMSKACAHGLPWQMQKLAMSLKIPEQKHIEGARLIRLFSIPKADGTFNEREDFPEDFEKFVAYCEQDVRVERQIDNKLPDLTEQEQKIFSLTNKINDRGLFIDQDLANEAIVIANELKTYCNEEVKVITKGKIHAVTQTVRLKTFINETYKREMTGVSADTIEGELEKDISDELRRLLILRLEFGRSSVAKFQRVIDSCCEDGRIRNHLVYHGASTGRWTGRDVQFQNLPRGGAIDADICIDAVKSGDSELFNLLYSNPMSALSTCIRGVVIAPPSKTLLVADYASIEARVLMWAVGQEDACELFRQKKDIYVEMAKVIHNNKLLTPKDKEERQLGKQAVLGCGFQMGAPRFKVTCEGYGIKVSDDLAKLAVDSYRATYKQVPSFWADIERAAAYTVRTKRACHCGPVMFYIKGKFLYCKLPSGRSLAYYYPGMSKKEMPWGKEKNCLHYYTVNSERNFKKTFTYGGKLTENVVQAMARDLMAEAMLKLENNGFPVVLSVHDEIICEIDGEEKSDFYLNQMIDIMCDVPKWAEGCPIDAEGWQGERYKK